MSSNFAVKVEFHLNLHIDSNFFFSNWMFSAYDLAYAETWHGSQWQFAHRQRSVIHSEIFVTASLQFIKLGQPLSELNVDLKNLQTISKKMPSWKKCTAGQYSTNLFLLFHPH